MILNFKDEEYYDFLKSLKTKYGFDFTEYAKASMHRRMSRFMINNHLESLYSLAERVLADQAFFEHFVEELTVNVTEMFRDPAFHAALRSKVVPVLKTYPHIRVWDAGCSSGEETYSLSIILKEEDMLKRARIYATDINQKVLSVAKEGIYPISYMKDYSKNYLNSGGKHSLSDYYHAKYNSAIMDKELIKNVVFSTHNLVQDGSFNEFNLIVCRNVLIYFNKDLQEKVLKLFMESLPMFGFLALGNKESLRFSNIETHFEVIDHKEKIFRKIK